MFLVGLYSCRLIDFVGSKRLALRSSRPIAYFFSRDKKLSAAA
jgi:hypothetical protein